MNHVAPIIIAAAVIVFAAYRLRRKGALRQTGHLSFGTDPDRPPRLGVVGLVAGREIRQRLRGRAFRIATLVLLIGVAAAVVIPAVVGGGSHTERVGLVGPDTPLVRRAVAAAARSTGTAVDVTVQPDFARAKQALRDGAVDVAVVDGLRIVVDKASTRDDAFPRALAQLLGLARAVRAADLTAGQAARLAQASPTPITSLQAAPSNDAGRSSAAVAVVIMFILLTQYLTWTLMGVMEEKSSRVVEVLLATLRPLQLLTGKLIGIAAVVFAQAALIAAFALVLGRAVGSDLLRGDAPLVLLSGVAWLVLGYAFYCWLYAAAGSTVERQDQVQSLALPLALPMIVGYIASISIASSGSSPTWFKVLAYLPPTAPFAMTTLVGLGAATWWQFAVSAVLTIAATSAVARLAATVYRRAILRTGRRVPLRELLGVRQ